MTTPTENPPPATGNKPILWFLAITLLTFLAASAAPTPMYHLYQQDWQFSAAMLTLVFGVYAIALLTALLIFGGISDHIGRKPVMFVAILLEIGAMGLFALAGNVEWLLAARILQGFATGIATSVLSATLFDTDHHIGSLINTMCSMGGIGLGAIAVGALVEFGPYPLHLSYLIIASLLVIEALVVWAMPETASRRPGALKSLHPKISVPPEARMLLLRVAPVNLSAWALGGFYLSLVPSLIALSTGDSSPLSGGISVALLTATGALSVFVQRHREPRLILRFGAASLTFGLLVILIAVNLGNLPMIYLGSLIIGLGFGGGFVGGLRLVMSRAPQQARAGLTSVFYIMSYLAFCIPAMLAGVLVRSYGLLDTANGFGIILMVLTFAALIIQVLRPVPAMAPAK